MGEVELSLRKKQELFSRTIANLIIHMENKGFTVTCGDFAAKERTPLEHKKGSKHYERCAADLNLFKDGVWLTKTEDHKQFGDYWESLHPLCFWGGRWNDGNHYQVGKG